MKPPTFFLSSTIYDFKDLRSAIKYHLEQQGCRVLASEFNDFSKPHDTHSYDACLASIQESDWFILLIGTRVGGWYDEAARISITQQEYREAYRLHQQGRLKLMIFVRSEVWQMREERNQLAKHLDSLGVDAVQKAKLVNYPSKSAEDAEFISAFITEVGRNKETLVARATGEALPTGNWIHSLATFQDFVDAIQLLPFTSRPLEEMALRRLLRRELCEILRVSLYKKSGNTPFSPRSSVDKFHNENRIVNADQSHDRHWINTASFNQLCSLSFSLFNTRYYPRILWKIIESSAFLRLDNVTSRFVEEPVYAGLLKLTEELSKLEKANQTDSFKVVFDNSPRARPQRAERIDVKTMDLIFLLHLLDRWCNVIELCKAIILYLDGSDFIMPALRPASPIYDEVTLLIEEEVTSNEVESFLKR